MSSTLKVKSPYFESNNGEAALFSYQFSQDKQIREITIKNTASAPTALFLTDTLVSGTISLGPMPYTYPGSTAGLQIPSDAIFTTIVKNSSDASGLSIDMTDLTTSADYPFGNILFHKDAFTESTSRNVNYLYNVNKHGDHIVNSYDSPLLESTTSFGLLRTNPKLTGNVKLTVDSTEKIWLNSIDANKELADSRFKKFPISANSNYVIDVFNFFDKGTTPPEIVYDLYQQAGSYYSTQRDFTKQYDRFYTYGAEQLPSKFYSEDFSYFAPLRIEGDLPDYFVIFRANGSVNEFTYTEAFEDWRNNVNQEILKKADIVKTFDLSENSNVGKYIRNLKNHPARKTSEMTVSLQRSGYTTFNGISYTEGSFAQKGELLANYFSNTSTILGTEEFLTIGFQRNRILSSSIINLEFLFDDNDAYDYSINRYFGLYLKKNEIATFFISDTSLDQHSLEINQTPLPRKGVDGNKLSAKSFVQNNPNGIKLFADTKTIQRTRDVADIFTTIVSDVDVNTSSVYFAGQWENSPLLSVGDTLSFIDRVSGIAVATANVNSITQENKRGKIGIDSFLSLPGITFDRLKSCIVDFTTEEKKSSRSISVFDNSLIQDASRLFYLQDKNGNFYNVNGTSNVTTKVSNFGFQTDIQIALNEKTLDISNFTGINEMLTQHTAELITKPGHSVVEFNLTDTFSDFDYLEISTITGSTSSESSPLKWRIKAQTPMLNPGEWWPDYSVVTDIDGSKYYLTIFHPGDSNDLTQLANSIVNAFNTFPFKVFDIVNTDNKIYIRSKEAGDVNNTLKIDFNLSKKSVRIYEYDNPIGLSSVNFFGGSAKTKNRVKISREIAEGILQEEYFQTTGKYSPLKSIQVFGNNVSYFSYLESPVYNNIEQISGFTDAENYVIIELADDSKFQLTHDNKITSYSLHKSKFGIFSILPLKDFDTDYTVSDYGRNYNAELIEYFDNIGAKTYDLSLDTSSGEYKVNFSEVIGLSGSYTFLGVYEDGRAPIDLNGLAKLEFSGATASAANLKFYVSDNSPAEALSNLSLQGNNAPSKLVVLPGNKILYFEENNLSKFKGFFSLSPVISAQDMQVFTQLESEWSFSRFFLSKISTEYQRLQENYIKELALTSKVVPYSVKWVSPDGKDIRDNPYRFNFSRAFGTMNFSPSGEFPDADSKIHTHEWSYLANVPKDVNPIKFADFAFSYFFEKPDSAYDFYSIKRDWFSEFFVTGYPAELYKVNGIDTLVPVETTEKYSVFKYDSLSKKTYTIFRGIRLEVGETLTANNSVLMGSSKYDGYKFSSVIVPGAEDDFVLDQDVSSDIIINEKFKFILNLIKVKVSSYKNPNGNISYVDLYTMENKRDRASYVINSTKVYPSGYDFRFDKGVPSDIEFPTKMTTASSGNKSLKVVDSTKNLIDFIKPLVKTGVYSYPYSIRTYNAAQQCSYVYENIDIVYAKKIHLNSSKFYLFNPSLGAILTRDINSSEQINKHTFYYASGGDFFYDNIKQNLSFYEITRILEKRSEEIKSKEITISSNGSVVRNKALFRVVTPEKFLQQYDYHPIPDLDKPAELFNYDVIGAVAATFSSPQYIYRYQGNFVPKFRDVFYFGSREQETFALEYNNDFKLANTFLAEPILNTYYLRNQYFCKVADEEILRINQSSGYKSIYPLVNEISIDKKDFFVWSSSWDNSYYKKYSTVTDYVNMRGTSEMQEIKSFLGSKMMKLSKKFNMFEFIISGESPELTYSENGNTITLTVDVYSRFLRELMGTTGNNRVQQEFARISESLPEAIASSEISTFAEDYLKKNILNLFEISKVNFYLLQTGNTGSLPGNTARPLIEFNTVSGIESTLSQTQFISKRYVNRKDVKTTLLSNLQLQIQFTTDTRFYTSLGLGVEVSRI